MPVCRCAVGHCYEEGARGDGGKEKAVASFVFCGGGMQAWWPMNVPCGALNRNDF